MGEKGITQEISLWGVGPSIIMATGTYAAVAGLVAWMWPEVCLISAISSSVFSVTEIVLLVIGIPMLAVAGRAATIAYQSDKLATTGIFGIVIIVF